MLPPSLITLSVCCQIGSSSLLGNVGTSLRDCTL